MHGTFAIYFFPETPTPKNDRFRGTFEDSIGYVYREKHVPRCWGKYVKKWCTDYICIHVCFFLIYWVLTLLYDWCDLARASLQYWRCFVRRVWACVFCLCTTSLCRSSCDCLWRKKETRQALNHTVRPKRADRLGRQSGGGTHSENEPLRPHAESNVNIRRAL